MTDFAALKSLFHLPKGIIYLDGNSLGPLPKSAIERLTHTVRDEWGELLIKGWNEAGWFNMPITLGNRIAPLIGAQQGSVVVGDTLSIKIYQALAAALSIVDNNANERKIILSDTGNFPTDIYMAQGLINTMNNNHQIKLVEPEKILENLDENIAVLMLTQTDYRTGRMHDMEIITAKAHEKGIITIWDLAHSAGAIPVDLTSTKADFAAGCTYKYLNAGPGSPAFIYVAPKHIELVEPALSGWLGHEAPFAFDINYRAGPAINRMRIGTPSILQFAALDAALDIWDMVSIEQVREKSLELSEIFIATLEKSCPELVLASPRDGHARASHVSFHFPDGYAAMKAVIERGVIGDFREPDIMRFAITPLYIDKTDLINAAEIIADVVNSGIWKNPEYQSRNAVT